MSLKTIQLVVSFKGITGFMSNTLSFPATKTPSKSIKPGMEMVDPEACKAIKRRPQLLLAGIVP